MIRKRLKLIGFLVAVLLYIVVHITGADLFEAVIAVLKRFEAYQLDEFVIPAGVFLFFLLFDMRERRKSAEIELEKIKIYKAMLSSTHHVLNNFLNRMQLFRMAAEETEDFPSEILARYDTIIDDATMQIKALSNIEKIDDISIISSVRPK